MSGHTYIESCFGPHLNNWRDGSSCELHFLLKISLNISIVWDTKLIKNCIKFIYLLIVMFQNKSFNVMQKAK